MLKSMGPRMVPCGTPNNNFAPELQKLFCFNTLVSVAQIRIKKKSVMESRNRKHEG